MKICRLIVFFWLSLLVGQIAAQDFSNKGKEFWIAYSSHIDGFSSVMGLYITSSVDTKATIQVGTSSYTVDVLANQVKTFFIGPTGGTKIDASNASVYLNMSDGVKSNGAIKVTALNPIVVYSHIIRSARSAATLVLPTPVLGTTYIAPGISSVSTSGLTNGGTTGGIGQISVVATQDNTIIEITPTVNGGSGRTAGNKFQITLPSAGDVYQFQTTSLGDISGTKIQSIASGPSGCKPIAVFAGASWSAFDCTSSSGGDNLYQQLFPTRSWGKTFVTAPFINRPNDIFRIYVQDAATVVSIQENGTSTTLGGANYNANGKFYFYRTNNPLIISASAPVSVVQFITSQTCKTGCTTSSTVSACLADPEMVILNPVEQTLNDITFFSAHANFVPPGQTQVTLHFVNIIINKSFKNSLKIDNALPTGIFVDIPNTNYSYLQENLTTSSASNPIHRVTADTGFSAIVYGYGNVESYGYNGGTNVIDLNPPISIQNDFSSTNVAYSATCSNTPFKINLSLTYQPTKIVVDFTGASGLNGPPTFTYPQNPTATLNFDSTYFANGKNYYVYRIPQSYSFNSIGNYPVKITTTSLTVQSDGCSNNNEQDISDNVVVAAPPTADFSIVSNGCINNAIALTDLSNGGTRPLVRWLWDFGDGTTSTVQNPAKTYTVGNNYTVKLTSITDFGCIAQITKPINVSAKPIAGFTVPATRCLSSNIVFTDASTIVPGTATNAIAQWRWDLDNGAGLITSTSNAAQNFTYTTWGNKNVYLVTESNTGCISDTFRIPGFKINPLPEVGFVIPEVCLADANAPFQDTSKIADGSEAQFVYAWKLNDGTPAISPGPNFSTSTIKNPAPKYNTVGNYTVTLKVTSNNNCVATLSSPFTVNGSIPNPVFTVQQLNPLCSNDSIRIINQSTVDFGSITRLDVYWDTIGSPASFVRDENPTPNNKYTNLYNSFSTPASKKVGIKITAYSGNSSVCRRSTRQEIILLNAPKATFTDIRDICYDAAPRQLTQGSFVSAIAGTATYSGKGISASGLLNPVTTGVGNDTIKYFVQNTAGCKDSAFQPLTVWPSPVAKWGVQSILCEKNDLAFTDSSAANFSNIVARNWIFGDGSTITNTAAGAFNKKYLNAQTYNASLQVVTDSGCISTVNQQIIKVNPLPVPAFSLPRICLPDGRGTFTNQSTIADNSESLFSYSWNFGDPNDPSTSTLKEPTHKYTAVGPVNVQLKITSKDACVDSLTKSLSTIFPWPKASFSATPQEICIGDSIQFKDLGDLINSGNTVTWNWDLSGGSSSILQNPKKVFTDSGTFAIKYFFYNVNGCVSDTVSKNVTVHPYPKLTLVPKINVLEGGSQKIVPKYVYGTNLTYLWTPPTYLNSDTDSVPVTTPLGDIRYKLYLKGIGGCTVSDTVYIKLLLAPLVPNAFSPNGDGINDRWRIQYLESYPGATVDVFNRYGQSVFSTVGYDVDWDGTVNGKPLPIGTYYYIINPKNGRKIISGSVTIIR